MKYAILTISTELLLNMFFVGLKPMHEIVQGVPADAKIVNVRHGWPNQIEILLSSESFDEVKEGDPFPQLNITVRTYQPDAVRV